MELTQIASIISRFNTMRSNHRAYANGAAALLFYLLDRFMREPGRVSQLTVPFVEIRAALGCTPESYREWRRLLEEAGIVTSRRVGPGGLTTFALVEQDGETSLSDGGISPQSGDCPHTHCRKTPQTHGGNTPQSECGDIPQSAVTPQSVYGNSPQSVEGENRQCGESPQSHRGETQRSESGATRQTGAHTTLIKNINKEKEENNFISSSFSYATSKCANAGASAGGGADATQVLSNLRALYMSDAWKGWRRRYEIASLPKDFW